MKLQTIPGNKFNVKGHRWQGAGVGQKDVVVWNQDLFGHNPKLICDVFDHVDRGAVHVGLAGFPQTPVTDWDMEAFKQAFQRRSPAPSSMFGWLPG